MVSDGQTVHFWPHSVIHNRKAVHLTSLNLWWEVNFRPPLKRQNFRDAYGLNCYPHPISCHMSQNPHLSMTNCAHILSCYVSLCSFHVISTWVHTRWWQSPCCTSPRRWGCAGAGTGRRGTSSGWRSCQPPPPPSQPALHDFPSKACQEELCPLFKRWRQCGPLLIWEPPLIFASPPLPFLHAFITMCSQNIGKLL